MPENNSELLLCYNRGCGSKFDPKNNKKDSCTFHPENPVFHDAYKSWPCCNKKCTDFTEFLNIKGCTTSYHSNVKPTEPERPVIDKRKSEEVIEYVAPISETPTIERPPFDTPLIKMKPEVSGALKTQMDNLVLTNKTTDSLDETTVGTSCKNGGCKVSYDGPQSSEGNCIHHPGVPVFHEGLKFWSCCQKRTTDFAAFLEQVGCESGKHVWVKEKTGNSETVCRYDWHQTGSHVIISIYAKKYDPVVSEVELNPVRVKIHLYFPEQNSSFNKDLELQGVIDVEKSQVAMLQTKVEIKMKKSEPGSWPKLDIPAAVTEPTEKPKVQPKPQVTSNDEDDAVDLSDVY